MIPSSQSLFRARLLPMLAASLFCFAAILARAAEIKKTFDLPSGDAEKTLKLFTEQSGEQILYPPVRVAGVQTNAVRGEMTAREALDRMLGKTPLTAVRNEKTGAYSIQKAENAGGTEKNVQRAALPMTSDRPTPAAPIAPGVDATHPDRKADANEMLALSPFEVRATKDSSYGALDSTSVTGFNTEMAKLPLSADIFNETLMKDLHITSVENMIATYSAGAGLTSADPSGSGVMQPGDRGGNATSNSLRGLLAPTMLRDSILPMGPSGASGSTSVGNSDSFDLERVEIVNGPQSLMYGGGGGGGVINVVSKRARLGAPAAGSFSYALDQYGNKRGTFDYGMGSKQYAVRMAVLSQTGTMGGRRLNNGGPITGGYAQFAFKVYNTVVRLTGERTRADLWSPNGSYTLTAVNAANDARNGLNLHYLLATNQIAAAANNAPSGAGKILNDKVNWNNIDSFAGSWESSFSTNSFSNLTADTKWNSWLSSQVVAVYQQHYDDWSHPTKTLLAPNVASNTLGTWAFSIIPADTTERTRNKAIRFALHATNSLFDDRVKSQTILGADFRREDLAVVVYNYFQADSNFTALRPANGPAVTQQRVQVPGQLWPVGNGPLTYWLWSPRQLNVTASNGQNYVRMISNEVNPALIGPNNPTGTNRSGNVYQFKKTLERGLYLTNYSQWLGGKLDTLVGARATNDEATTVFQLSPPNLVSKAKVVNFSAGADYAVFPWLHPYFVVSDSFDPPIIQDHNPVGDVTEKGKALGKELGFKVQNASGTFSGTVALFHTDSKNEETKTTSVITGIINPTGLNGRYLAPSNWINVDRKSSGVQASLTATPKSNWRIRWSAAFTDGRVLSTTGYSQLYNDEFHANGQGQVTFADGTVLYVPATFDAKNLSVPSSAPGAQPLTIKMMSDPASSFYANPAVSTGAINGGSAAAVELKQVDPVHGAILTGRTGLPISALQITGVAVPAYVNTSIAGEATVGYPLVSSNLTSMYTVRGGPLSGLRFGGAGVFGWKVRAYYYYLASPTGPGSPRRLFLLPNTVRLDPILGYSHKFHRFNFDTQLNITNVFNHYHIVITPNGVSGFNSGMNAGFDQQPRAYVWSNTVGF